MRAWREQTKAQSGLSRKDASYWFCVLLIGEYIFFILLRRHIFVFFTRILFFLSLMCSLLLACCYLVAHIVGTGSTSSGQRHEISWNRRHRLRSPLPKWLPDERGAGRSPPAQSRLACVLCADSAVECSVNAPHWWMRRPLPCV